MNTADLALKLALCPFCGKVPKLVDNGSTGNFAITHQCVDDLSITTRWMGPAKLVKAWNTRALP